MPSDAILQTISQYTSCLHLLLSLFLKSIAHGCVFLKYIYLKAELQQKLREGRGREGEIVGEG